MNTALVSQEKISAWAGGIHILSMIASWCTLWFVGFGGMATGFIMWALQENKQGLVAQNAAEVFNQHFSLFLYVLLSGIFAVVTFGIGLLVVLPFWLVLAISWLIVSINSARRGFEGDVYRAPFVVRILK